MLEPEAISAWSPFFVCSISFFGGAVTLFFSSFRSRDFPSFLLLFLSSLLFGFGFMLGGMQAGPAPVIPREVLIPWIRFLWLLAGLLAGLFQILLWLRLLGWGYPKS